MPDIILTCGCRANWVRTMTAGKQHEPIPSCIAHNCTTVADPQPDLTGRTAKCGYHAEKPSNPSLPFFVFCGEGSREAMDICKCGYAEAAHRAGVWTYDTGETNHPFEPRGALPHDRYYCGCQGWD